MDKSAGADYPASCVGVVSSAWRVGGGGMDEAEWLACADPQKMLEFLWASGKLSERKARLFAVACCRRIRIWHLLTDQRSWQAVEAAERHADGVADDAELERHLRLAFYAAMGPSRPASYAAEAANLAASGPPPFMATLTVRPAAEAVASSSPVGRGDRDAQISQEQGAQAALLRDIIGNPFRPVVVSPAWLTWHAGLVVRLAQAAYEERQLPAGTLDKDRLAVLADALEEAGCTDPDILNHCRRSGVHVRGCWAVDLLLGKV
jgi:hypothetical protein